MYRAKLNNKEQIAVNLHGNSIFVVDGNEYRIVSYQPERGLVSINNGQDSYKVIIQKVDYQNKAFQLRLNGIKHTIHVKDKFDIILDELGYDSKSASSLNQLKAPMPGLILEVSVAGGDPIKKGDKLLVLEAMKMENVIKSPGEGIVKEVKIAKGDSVEKNQILIQF